MCVSVGSVRFFVCRQKTAYEMRISDWSSDVGSSDLECPRRVILAHVFAVVVHILSLPAHPQAPAEPQIAGQLAGKLTALVDAPLKPQLATTAAQERFNLGIALKALRHARPFLPRLFPARHVAGPIEAVQSGPAALPAFHEPIGAQ